MSTDDGFLYTVYTGDLNGAKTLLRLGANPNAYDFRGRTALHISVERALDVGYDQQKMFKMFEFLLTLNVKLDTLDNSMSESPLHLAVSRRGYALVTKLLDHGAKADIRNKDFTTPLMLAVRYGDVAMVEMLLHKGADPEAEDINKCPVMQHVNPSQVIGAHIKRLLMEEIARRKQGNAQPQSTAPQDSATIPDEDPQPSVEDMRKEEMTAEEQEQLGDQLLECLKKPNRKEVRK